MLDSGRKTNIMDAKYLRTILWLQKKEVIFMFIRGFSIHWDDIQEDSYLRNIPALRGMNGFMFPGAFHGVPSTGDGVYSRWDCADSGVDSSRSGSSISL